MGCAGSFRLIGLSGGFKAKTRVRIPLLALLLSRAQAFRDDFVQELGDASLLVARCHDRPMDFAHTTGATRQKEGRRSVSAALDRLPTDQD